MTNILLLLFILLRPFYVRASGQVQPADGFLMLYFFCTVYRDFKAEVLVPNIKKNKLFYIFLVFAIMINAFYHKVVPDPRFLFSSLYLIYMGVVVYSYDSGINKGLIDKIRYILYGNLMIQFLIYSSGLGRLYYELWEEGATRYMGTFTDPNQFGFYIFIVLLFAYLTKHEKADTYLFPITSVMGIFLVIQSKSLAAFLGLAVLYTLALLRFIGEKFRVNKVILCVMLILTTTGVVYYFIPTSDFRIEDVEYNTVNRIRYKIYNVIYADGIKDILRERAAEKIINYPEYFIYGAGEGNYERYYPEPVNEIHSSFINLFFSYGLIPFAILMGWFKKRLKGLNAVSLVCFITILIESMFLVNYRQALFWVLWITLFYLNEPQKNADS
jgi:hypothetical protein